MTYRQFKTQQLKKDLITIFAIVAILLVCAFTNKCEAQSKSDSLKLSRTDLTTLQRNSLLIQQTIHRLSMDALLRDKLDSVYSQSAVLFDERLKKKP